MWSAIRVAEYRVKLHFLAFLCIIMLLVVVEGDVDSVQFKKSPTLPAVKSDSASGGSVSTAAARGDSTLMYFAPVVHVPTNNFIQLSDIC